jgi:putative ABC transport system permease protein
MPEKRRFMAALAGIAFAVALMLTQLGFEDALLSTADLLYSHLAGDLVLINPEYQFIISPKTFTERRLYQSLGCDSVESVQAVYTGQGRFKNPFDWRERDIFLVGFNPRSAAVNVSGITEKLESLRDPEKVLFDSIHRPEFGQLEKSFMERGSVTSGVCLTTDMTSGCSCATAAITPRSMDLP